MPDDGVRDGMLRPLLDGRGETDHRRSAGAVQRHHVDDFGRAAGERPRLVEGNAAHAARALEMRAALDQHAFARGAGQRRDDRDRRRNDERAGTRHDEQHERAVQPGAPVLMEDERRANRNEGGERHDHGRVHAREALDEHL